MREREILKKKNVHIRYSTNSTYQTANLFADMFVSLIIAISLLVAMIIQLIFEIRNGMMMASLATQR